MTDEFPELPDMGGDLFSSARRHAAMLREFHDAYVEVGFTEDQAFAMTKDIQEAVLQTEVYAAATESGGDE